MVGFLPARRNSHTGRKTLEQKMQGSQMQHLAELARHDESARRLLADMHHLVDAIREAAEVAGAAEPLRTPVYYAPQAGTKRNRTLGE
jgi:hypothetical protein